MKHSIAIELGESVLTRNSKLVLYSHQWNLLRILDPALISHPHIMLYSNILLFSNAPFIQKHSEKLRVYSIALEKNEKSFHFNLQNYEEILTYTDNSCILVSQNQREARILQFHVNGTVDEYIIEKPDYILPQGIYSYVVKNQGSLAIVKNPTQPEEIMKCKRVIYKEMNGYKILQCITSDNVLLIISDNLYGYAHDYKGDDFTITDVYMGLNTITINSLNRTMLINFSKNGAYIYELPHPLRNATFIDDNVVLGTIDNNLVLYNTKRNSFKILRKIDSETSIYMDIASGYVILKNNEKIELMDLKNDFLISMKTSAKDAIVSDSKLFLLSNNRVAIYTIETVSKKINIEKLYEAPTTLVHCINADSKNILCIDLLGRLLRIDVKYLFSYKPAFLKLRSDQGLAILLKSFTPGYPIKIFPSENVHIRFKRLSTISTKASIFTDSRKKLTLNVTVHGVIDSIEKCLKINYEKFEFYFQKPKIIEDVLILNGFPIVCNEKLRHSIRKCIEDMQRISSLDAIMTCLIDENKEKGFVALHQLVFMNRIHFVNIAPSINFENDTICIDNVNSLKHADVKLKILCSNKLYTIDNGCLKLGDCEYVKLLLTVKPLNDECLIEIPIQHNTSLNIELHEKSSATFSHGLSHKVLLPTSCGVVKSSRVIYRNGFLLEVVIANECDNIALTVLLPTQSFIVMPHSEKIVEEPINGDDIVRGHKDLAILEPCGAKLVMFPFDLSKAIAFIHGIALKISAITGLRRWVKRS